MKKLFQTLAILFVLTLATSAWSAGTIKTFNMKLYPGGSATDATDPEVTYTGWDQQTLGGVTTGANGAGAEITYLSSVSELTHSGGPGNANAIPNTTDARTIDLNDHIAEFGVGFDVTFWGDQGGGVTLGAGIIANTANSTEARWMYGVKFSPVDEAASWALAPVFWAGPLTNTYIDMTYDDRGGVTAFALESGESPYPKAVVGLGSWLHDPDTIGGGSAYVVPPMPSQRYMRGVFAGTTNFRNVEVWMSLIPR